MDIKIVRIEETDNNLKIYFSLSEKLNECFKEHLNGPPIDCDGVSGDFRVNLDGKNLLVVSSPKNFGSEKIISSLIKKWI
ncbi:MAG: hypothetical protein KAT28_00130 [Candidatus Aenigmarchaeota archaeon]|nr:hypothetical protein [Candidatus Aenigmarchaeota archaeon]